MGFDHPGVPCGPIYNDPQASASTQAAALKVVHYGRRQVGSPLPSLRGPLNLDGEASEITAPPPLVGEHREGAFP